MDALFDRIQRRDIENPPIDRDAVSRWFEVFQVPTPEEMALFERRQRSVESEDQPSLNMRDSGDRSITLPRVLARMPLRCHSFKGRLAVNIVMSASFRSACQYVMGLPTP